MLRFSYTTFLWKNSKDLKNLIWGHIDAVNTYHVDMSSKPLVTATASNTYNFLVFHLALLTDSSPFLVVPSRLSCPGCPVSVVLSQVSCFSHPVLAILFWLFYPGYSVLAVLSWFSCPRCLVLSVLFWLFCPGCRVLVVVFLLPSPSCPGCPVMAVLAVVLGLCWLSCQVSGGCPVLHIILPQLLFTAMLTGPRINAL